MLYSRQRAWKNASGNELAEKKLRKSYNQLLKLLMNANFPPRRTRAIKNKYYKENSSTNHFPYKHQTNTLPTQPLYKKKSNKYTKNGI